MCQMSSRNLKEDTAFVKSESIYASDFAHRALMDLT